MWTARANAELKVYNWTIIQSHSNEKRANENHQMPECRASLWKLWEEIEKFEETSAWKWSRRSCNISIPMMGWLRTVKSINRLVLLVLLINCNHLIEAASSSTSSPADGAIATVVVGGGSIIATTIRERSAKFSSERIKGKLFVAIYITENDGCWMEANVESFSSDPAGNYKPLFLIIGPRNDENYSRAISETEARNEKRKLKLASCGARFAMGWKLAAACFKPQIK